MTSLNIRNVNPTYSLLTVLLTMVGAFFVPFSASAVDIPKPDFKNATGLVYEGYKEWEAKVKSAEEEGLGSFDKAQVWGDLAMYLIAHDYYWHAEKALAKAIDYASGDARWHYLMAYIESSDGESKKAVDEFLKALELNPYYFPAMVRLADTYVKLGNFEKAINWYKSAKQSKETHTVSLVGLGKIALQSGEAEKALKYFQEAFDEQPGASKLHFYIGQAYGMMGKMDKAESHLRRQGEAEVTMSDPLIFQVEKLSRSATSLNKKAVKALYSKNFQKALNLALLAAKASPDSPYPLLTLAYVYSESGNHKKASEAMKKVLQLAPKNADMLYAAGVIDEIGGDDEAAIINYEQVLSVDAEYVKALISLAKAYGRTKKFNKALPVLEKAAEVNPENPFLPHRLAHLYFYLGACEKAKASEMKAIELQPENFAFLTGFVRIVAECGGNAEEQQKALNAARNMYRIAPVLPVIEALAAIEYAQGNNADALDYQTQALFEAAKKSVPPWLYDRLRKNYKGIKQHKKISVVTHPEEEELSPARLKSIL